MEITSNSITITDATIVSYYKENATIDIITMNHILIDILRKLSSNLSETINTSMNGRILSVVSNIEKNITTLKTDFNEKIYETKREYIEDIKVVLTNNSLTNNEKINSILEKTADNILTKTTLLINDVVPRSNEKIYSQLEGCIKTGCLSIEQDTKKLLESNNKDETHSKDLITNIDNHFSKMVLNIQQPIFSFIQSSEERTITGIQQIKDGAVIQQHFQEKLTNELNEFLNKYKHNSSIKGQVSETELYHMLQHVMPLDEILNVSTETASCDFRVNRHNASKPSILFENKDYKRSVTTEEVRKFERDIQTQKLHGIFISQKTPITFKEDFQIDIIGGLIHVYMPNTNYDTTKLKIAIDIIDSLSSKLAIITHTSENTETSYFINQEDIDELAEDYRQFGLQKTAIQETIRVMNKQLVDFQLPKIKNILVKLGIIENDTDFKCIKCNYCNISWKNKASLAAHIRNCKSSPKNKEEVLDLLDNEPIVETKKNKPSKK